jgi:4'-phosphopantetheinyl transferase EntD
VVAIRRKCKPAKRHLVLSVDLIAQDLQRALPFLIEATVLGAAQGESLPETIVSVPPTYSEKRRREHILGRLAARQALDKLGVPLGVARDPEGVPIFPPGIAGSITHTGHQLTTAATIVSRSCRAIGIDLEELSTLSSAMAERIVLPEEVVPLRNSAFAPDHEALFAFSAKEAFYKCVYPEERQFLGFHEVLLRVSPGADTAADGEVIHFEVRHLDGRSDWLPGIAFRRQGLMVTVVYKR